MAASYRIISLQTNLMAFFYYHKTPLNLKSNHKFRTHIIYLLSLIQFTPATFFFKNKKMYIKLTLVPFKIRTIMLMKIQGQTVFKSWRRSHFFRTLQYVGRNSSFISNGSHYANWFRKRCKYETLIYGILSSYNILIIY